jgi:hypothetical protein
VAGFVAPNLCCRSVGENGGVRKNCQSAGPSSAKVDEILGLIHVADVAGADDFDTRLCEPGARLENVSET